MHVAGIDILHSSFTAIVMQWFLAFCCDAVTLRKIVIPLCAVSLENIQSASR